MNNPNKLYGAILGDLAGQPYEYKYTGDFSEFNIHNPDSNVTDDSIMTLATASYLLGDYKSFDEVYRYFGQKYYGDFYGNGFKKWLASPKDTIGTSYGNGCLMRISPIMHIPSKKNWSRHDLDEKKTLILESCLTSHSHPKSILACLDLLELYESSDERKEVYRCSAKIEPFNEFQIESDKTINFIINAYILANDDIPKSTIDRIERVVKCGGDTDTNASIIGEIMNYTYNDLSPQDIEYVESKLDSYLLSILKRFNKKFK